MDNAKKLQDYIITGSVVPVSYSLYTQNPRNNIFLEIYCYQLRSLKVTQQTYVSGEIFFKKILQARQNSSELKEKECFITWESATGCKNIENDRIVETNMIGLSQ